MFRFSHSSGHQSSDKVLYVYSSSVDKKLGAEKLNK